MLKYEKLNGRVPKNHKQNYYKYNKTHNIHFVSCEVGSLTIWHETAMLRPADIKKIITYINKNELSDLKNQELTITTDNFDNLIIEID